jgi:hypothetical protein
MKCKKSELSEMSEMSELSELSEKSEKSEIYEKYEMGEIEEQQFRQHLESCESCRQKKHHDNLLLEAARSLKEPASAPGLWERIESDLMAEQSTIEPPDAGRFKWRFHPLIAAGIVLVAVAIGIFLGIHMERHDSGLLSKSALNKVQQTELRYIAAISRLEAQAGDRMKSMDIELMLLYKDRLAVIDHQIKECQNALKQNTANSHIRRYMLAALQDKKDTLIELLRPQESLNTGSNYYNERR